MKVLVLGSRGMLGATVARRLAELGHDVSVTSGRYAGSNDDPLIAEVMASDAEAIVNCAGVVNYGPGLMVTNALLPLHLAALGRLLIQPSTDCVFDGRRGWYDVDEPPNATDAYGLSKRLGEGCAASAIVLRTSIVGPGERGLLGWFLRQEEPVEGWTDHIWNGITTLAWADLAAAILEGGFSPGIYQPTTEYCVTKFEMLRLFGEVFRHPITVKPVTTKACDRTLKPTYVMPPLPEQLVTLRDWMAA